MDQMMDYDEGHFSGHERRIIDRIGEIEKLLVTNTLVRDGWIKTLKVSKTFRV
jgi:hypothetical protein